MRAWRSGWWPQAEALHVRGTGHDHNQFLAPCWDPERRFVRAQRRAKLVKERTATSQCPPRSAKGSAATSQCHPRAAKGSAAHFAAHSSRRQRVSCDFAAKGSAATSQCTPRAAKRVSCDFAVRPFRRDGGGCNIPGHVLSCTSRMKREAVTFSDHERGTRFGGPRSLEYWFTFSVVDASILRDGPAPHAPDSVGGRDGPAPAVRPGARCGVRWACSRSWPSKVAGHRGWPEPDGLGHVHGHVLSCPGYVWHGPGSRAHVLCMRGSSGFLGPPDLSILDEDGTYACNAGRRFRYKDHILIRIRPDDTALSRTTHLARQGRPGEPAKCTCSSSCSVTPVPGVMYKNSLGAFRLPRDRRSAGVRSVAPGIRSVRKALSRGVPDEAFLSRTRPGHPS